MTNLNENHELTANGNIDINDPAVRDAVNAALADATFEKSLTPYIAWGKVQKVLALHHIYLPAPDLEGTDGNEAVEVNQFGEKIGANNDGEVVEKNSSGLYLYFEWQQEMCGMFTIFTEVVTEEELDDILDDFQDEMEDNDEEELEESVMPDISKKMNNEKSMLHLTMRKRMRKMKAKKELAEQHDEEKTQINEISKKLMVNYMTKADKEVRGVEKSIRKTGDITPQQDKQLTKRVKGMNIARDKFYMRAKIPASGNDKAYSVAQAHYKTKGKIKEETIDEQRSEADNWNRVKLHGKILKKANDAVDKKDFNYARKAVRVAKKVYNSVAEKPVTEGKDVPWDQKPGDDKPSTPYKNPHSKSKQLARSMMKKFKSNVDKMNKKEK